MSEYKVVNQKPYTVAVLRFEFLPGENLVKMNELEMKQVSASNGLEVEEVTKEVTEEDSPKRKK